MQVKKFEAKTMKEALDLVKVHMGPEAIILSAKDTHRGFGLMGDKSVEVTAAVSDETLRRKKIADTKLREELRQRFQQIPASQQKQFINKVFKENVRETVTPGVSAEVRAQTKGMRYIDIDDGEAAAQAQSVQRGYTQQQMRANQQNQNRQNMQNMDGGYENDHYQNGGQQYSQPQRQQRPTQNMQGNPGTQDQQRARSPQERGRQATREIVQEQEMPQSRSARISAAAAAAASAARATFSAPPAQAAVKAAAVAAAQQETQSHEVRALENQVRELKAIVERFQSVPQIQMTMHPGADQGLSFELSGIYQRLTGQGINPQLVTSLLRKAHKEIDPETMKKPALVDAWAVRRLLDTVEVAQNPTANRYHVFMGSTAQGKTTTLVKFASHLMLKEKKTLAIISLDTMKLGAADQLRMYAQILNVPFAIVRNPEEWRAVEQKLAHVNHIMVDCPGFSLRTNEEREWLQKMLPPGTASKSTHYVQSIIGRDEEALEIAQRYQAIGFNDVIFTRLDESGRQGMILNFQDRFKVPLHSFAFGTRIPEDYEFATKERVVDFIFKLSKVTRREEQA